MARLLIRDIFRLGNFSPSSISLFSTSSSPYLRAASQQNQSQQFPASDIILNILAGCQSLNQLHHIHAHLISSGRIQNPFFASKLLNLYSQLENLRRTVSVFYSINFPDRVCANTMIKAYSFSPVPQQGVAFYFEMLKGELFAPNSFTFPPLVGCCAQRGCAKLGGICHGQAIKNGADRVVQVQNSLIHMYACCGHIKFAQSMFDEMSERDLVSWNSIVDGYMKVGHLNTARSLFDVMPEKDVDSWNVMLAGHLAGNNPGCVLKLFREMVRKEVIGNGRTMVSLLTACGRSARLKEGMSVHGYLVRRLWKLNLFVATALIDMYCKCQKVEVARFIFDTLSERNLVCWNSMIVGHCLHGDPDNGLNLFAAMVGSRTLDDNEENEAGCSRTAGGWEDSTVSPDEITFVGVLCACARAGYLAKGRAYFHEMIQKYDIKPNFAHLWCMANLLASNGLLQDAMDTVRKVTELDENLSSESFVWASLLGSCRFQGDVSLGEQVARSLIEVEPQNIMCYALLFNIYAAAGGWRDAYVVKEMVKERFDGKMPGCSLIDLIEIVHGFKVGEGKREGIQIAMMMEDLVQKLR